MGCKNPKECVLCERKRFWVRDFLIVGAHQYRLIKEKQHTHTQQR
jgi:hypothetical protein